LLSHPEAALFWDPGLGKSSVVLSALVFMTRARGAKRTLIIAPKRACEVVWSHEAEGELSKWTDFQHIREVFLHGPKKLDLIEEDADIYLVNFDAVQWLTSCPDCEHSHVGTCRDVIKVRDEETGKDRKRHCNCKTQDAPIDRLIARGVNTLVVDELSKFKHTPTKRFKSMKRHLGRFKRRWGLTGDPAANNMEDLFGEAFTIDLGRSLGKSISGYRFKYFRPTGYGGYTWVVQSKEAEAAIYKRMKDVAIAMRAEDHLDLPELVEENIWVDLPDDVRERYDELEDELFTLIGKHEIVAANAAVASGQCRQVASGGLYAHTKKKTRKTLLLHHAKTEALVDLVDELQGSPLLVGYEFHHDLDRIREKLGDVPALNGETKSADFKRLVVEWNAGKIPVLCGQPQSMGHALNLQRAGSHVAFYTTPWDGELVNQVIRRVWRQGNESSRVVVHRIVARKTVDEDVLASLARKKRGQLALFEALKAGVTARRQRASKPARHPSK